MLRGTMDVQYVDNEIIRVIEMVIAYFRQRQPQNMQTRNGLHIHGFASKATVIRRAKYMCGDITYCCHWVFLEQFLFFPSLWMPIHSLFQPLALVFRENSICVLWKCGGVLHSTHKKITSNATGLFISDLIIRAEFMCVWRRVKQNIGECVGV